MKELSISFTSLEEQEAKNLILALEKLGYRMIPIEESIQKEHVILLALTLHSNKENILKFNSWLKNQYMESSIHHLKVMPVFLYHEKDGTPEDLFEEKIQGLYEEIFSCEFKPYAWNLDGDSPEREFRRVLDDYSE